MKQKALFIRNKRLAIVLLVVLLLSISVFNIIVGAQELDSIPDATLGMSLGTSGMNSYSVRGGSSYPKVVNMNYQRIFSAMQADPANNNIGSIKNQRWLFNHGYLGAEIVDGIENINGQWGLPTVNIIDIAPRTNYNVALHAPVSGQVNIYDVFRDDSATFDDKMQYFSDFFEHNGWLPNGTSGANVAVNMFSINNAVQDMADSSRLNFELNNMHIKGWEYIRNTEEKRRLYPAVTIIYTTMPLVYDDGSAERTTRNLMAYYFNEYLRNNIPPNALLFDIAAIQNNGQAIKHTDANHIYAPNFPYQSLDSAFAGVGEGKMNLAGQEVVAKSWYVMANSVAYYRASYNPNLITDPVFNPNKDYSGVTDPIEASLVGISCSTNNSIVFYTTDGSDPVVNVEPNPSGSGNIPDTNATHYLKNIVVPQDKSITVKAIAVTFSGGEVEYRSNIVTKTFLPLSNPIIVYPVLVDIPSGSTVTKGTEVKLSWDPRSQDVDIFYTLDGSDPRNREHQYYKDFYHEPGKIIINQNGTIRIIALKGGVFSEETVASYTVTGSGNSASSSSESSGSGGSSRGGGSGGRTDSSVNTTSKSIVSVNLSDTKITKGDIEKLSNENKIHNGTVTIKNKNILELDTANSIKLLTNKPTTINVDYVNNARVEVRISINVEKTNQSVRLLGYTSNTKAVAIKNMFGKFFGNKIMVVNLEQVGDFGQNVKMVVKIDSDLKVDNLHFYTYNTITKKYTPIDTKYTIDQNGYVHFETFHGDNIIISEGALTKK